MNRLPAKPLARKPIVWQSDVKRASWRDEYQKGDGGECSIKMTKPLINQQVGSIEELMSISGLCSHLLRISPTKALGLAYLRLGRFTAALKSYGRAIELEGTRIFALIESGNIYLMLGSYKKLTYAKCYPWMEEDCGLEFDVDAFQ